MLSRLSLITLGAVLLIAGTATSYAADDSPVLKRIKERGTVNLGHREASVPFSYIGDDGKPQGYSIDLCMKFIDAIKAEIGMPDLKVKLVPVTSQTRIALMANGTIDLECGSTTHNLTRRKQVDYLPTTFITGTKIAGDDTHDATLRPADHVHHRHEDCLEEGLRYHRDRGPEWQDGRAFTGHHQ